MSDSVNRLPITLRVPPSHKKSPSAVESQRSLASLHSRRSSLILSQSKLTKSSESSPKIDLTHRTVDSRVSLTPLQTSSRKRVMTQRSIGKLAASVYIHKTTKPPLGATQRGKVEGTGCSSEEQLEVSGDESRFQTVAANAVISSKNASETLKNLSDFETTNRTTYSRRHSVQAGSRKEDKQTTETKTENKLDLLNLQPVLNLRKINTIELLRSESEEAEAKKGIVIPIPVSVPKKLTVPSPKAKPRAYLSLSPKAEMRNLIIDYQLTTSSVLSDTKFLVKESQAARKVPQRLLDV